MPRPDRNQLKQTFGTTEPPLTVQEVDAMMYGDILAVDALRMEATPTDIFSIRADLIQPRRAIASEFRRLWDGSADSVATLFSQWYQAAKRERQLAAAPNREMTESEKKKYAQFDLFAYLESSDDSTDSEMVPGPLEAGFLQIVNLASSIRRDGLINPITIAPSGGEQYRVETGERRWLAYHLLHALYTGRDGRPDEREQWRRIPARIVQEASVWRMANENNQRANLNAISKARQLALLLFDIHQARGRAFRSYAEMVDAAACDRAFYAQIADGEQFRIPRGEVDKVLNAMGFGSSSQLREYRDLLRLPDEVWTWADDLNWTQGRLRDLKRKATEDDHLNPNLFIQKARQQAEREGLNVGTPTLSDIPNAPTLPPPPPEKDPLKRGKRLISSEKKAALKWLMGMHSGVGQADSQTRERVLEEIGAARRWLDDLEAAARKGEKGGG